MEAEPRIDELLRRWQAGDSSAARALVEQLLPLVSRIVACHRPLRIPHEDLCQEVFMSVFTDLHHYRGPQPLSHWVSRVAVNTCLDALRREKRRPEIRMADLSESESETLVRLQADPSEINAEDRHHAREIVEKLLERLSPENQLVIRLLHLEERPVAEIARLTGWSAPMIKVRAFRARQTLRRLITNSNRPTTDEIR